MTDTTNPRAELDAALEAMRDTGSSRAENADRITLAAVVACAEALSLLVDAHLAAVKPKPKPQPEPDPDPREDLPDDTPVGHGWVTAWNGRHLFKPECDGSFTWWLGHKWGATGSWEESELVDPRPATVGDLRRVKLPVTEWPDITAPEPEPEPDLRESLPDDTPVGHRWVMGRNGQELFRQRGNGYFTWWFRGARKWGAPGGWSQSGLGDTRPATVGDLRRVELPVTEWPDITAPEPEASCAEKAEAELRARELHHFEPEQSEAKAIAERDNAIAALRAVRDRLELGVRLTDPDGDIRKGYQEALMVVETGVRSHDIDLGEGMS